MGRSCLCWGLMGICLLAFPGCNGCGRPPRPSPPPLSPGAIGKAAIKQYDTNGDSLLDAEEIEKCASLKKAMVRIDADGDGKLTAAEITQRIKVLLDGVTLFQCAPRITLDGVAIEGATVTFEPEKFMGDRIKPCTGISDKTGDCFLQGPDKQNRGIYPGLYRVKISKMVDGKETIPERYNTETILGHEEADDIPGVGFIEFKLESK